MHTRIINDIEWTSSKLQIQDTTRQDIKRILYTTPVLAFDFKVQDHVALMLSEMECYIQEDWIDSVTHEVIRLSSERVNNIIS